MGAINNIARTTNVQDATLAPPTVCINATHDKDEKNCSLDSSPARESCLFSDIMLTIIRPERKPMWSVKMMPDLKFNGKDSEVVFITKPTYKVPDHLRGYS